MSHHDVHEQVPAYAADIPERALKRVLILDKLDGEPAPCTWMGKPTWVFFLRKGVAVASSARMIVGVPGAAYNRVRVSGEGSVRVVHLDERDVELTFPDEAAALDAEMRLMERQQIAEKIEEKKREAEREAAEEAEAKGDAVESPHAEGLVRRLERLAKLHSSGALTDAEYADAKAALLRGF